MIVMIQLVSDMRSVNEFRQALSILDRQLSQLNTLDEFYKSTQQQQFYT